MNKIQRVSRILQKIFLLLLIALPLTSIFFWFYCNIPNPSGIETSYFHSTPALMQQPHFYSRLAAFTINLIPLSIEMFCLYCLIKLFKLYEQGRIFTQRNVDYIRYIALCLIADPIQKPFNELATTFALTLSNPPGHRMISITLNTIDINNILIGVVILLASWVMAEACKLHDEQTLTV